MKLTIDSICIISKIIDKLQPNEEFIKDLFKIATTAQGKNKEEKEQIQNEIGIKIVMKLGTKLHQVRDELVEFISMYKGISKEDAEKIDMIDFVKELMEDEELKSFLKRQAVSKLKK